MSERICILEEVKKVYPRINKAIEIIENKSLHKILLTVKSGGEVYTQGSIYNPVNLREGETRELILEYAINKFRGYIEYMEKDNGF